METVTSPAAEAEPEPLLSPDEFSSITPNKDKQRNNVTSASASSVPRPTTSHITPQALMSPMTPVSGERALVPTLQNVVSTVNMSCTLDLMKINFRTRNSEYNPARFNGIVMRIREPRTTALIFRSGKMVVTGARNEVDSQLAARKYARIIQRLGFPVKFLDFKIQNIVGTCDVRFPIRLESLNMMHGQFSSYEPELFPGLIYRMVKPRVVLLIFVNGKVVMTGGKTREQLQEALDNMHPILKSFKKQ